MVGLRVSESWEATYNLREERMKAITIGNQRVIHVPRDRERRIVPRNTDFAAGEVEVRAFVFDLGRIAQYCESVSEADRHIALPEVLG